MFFFPIITPIATINIATTSINTAPVIPVYEIFTMLEKFVKIACSVVF